MTEKYLITFREIEEKDISSLYQRLQEPNVAQRYTWWELGFEEYQKKMISKIESDYLFAYIIMVDDMDVGYIQCYDCTREWYPSFALPNTWWVDMFIGTNELRGKGLWGVILKEFVESIVKKIHHADKVIIDPEVDNQIAIKAYQKAWFVIEREFFENGEHNFLMVSQ